MAALEGSGVISPRLLYVPHDPRLHKETRVWLDCGERRDWTH